MAQVVATQAAWGFVDAITESPSKKQAQEALVTVTRRDSSGKVWVHFDGSVQDTPVAVELQRVSVGERCKVSVHGGRVTIVGNSSSPALGAGLVDEAIEPTKNVAKTSITMAREAKLAANAAVSDAGRARSAADSASRDAATANVAAQRAVADADAARVAAIDAQRSAGEAKEDAAEAKASAERANTAATDALTQLSFVEDVSGTLDWIQSHGTFVASTDTSVQEGTVYFELSGSDYVPVIPEGDEDPSDEGWYVLDTTESQTDYIMAHLAVTSAGLWVLPSGIGSASTPQQASGYKMLLANDGTYIYDGSGHLVTSLGESITFDSERPQSIGGEDAFITYYDTDDDGHPDSIYIGGSNVTIGSRTLSELDADIKGSRQLWGTCSTGASTATKSVTCADATSLYAGLTIAVKFSTANTALAPQLNVNSLGAKAIWVDNAVTSTSNTLFWNTNATIRFTYDGTQWVVIDQPTTYYATCSTAASTTAKAAACATSVVRKGTTVTVRFTYAHTSANAATLYITGQSGTARSIYVNGSTVTSANANSWASGEAVAFVYNGQYWYASRGEKGDTGAQGPQGEAGAQGPQGETGPQGDTGVGIESIVEQWYLSTSEAEPTGGEWSTSQYSWVEGMHIWSRSLITWDDGTTTTTTPVLASAINSASAAAATAQNTADEANAALEGKADAEGFQSLSDTITQYMTDNDAKWDQAHDTYATNATLEGYLKTEDLASEINKTENQITMFVHRDEVWRTPEGGSTEEWVWDTAIRASTDNITTEVNKRYTKDEVDGLLGDKADSATVAEISTRVTQNATDISTLVSSTGAISTLIRQYGDGVLVCKVDQAIGALVNADGSFDVVPVAWEDGTPTTGIPITSIGGETSYFGSRTGFRVAIETVDDGGVERQRLGFYNDQNQCVAYMQGGYLYVENSMVLQSMKVGQDNPETEAVEGWEWRYESNGNLTLAWIG